MIQDQALGLRTREWFLVIPIPSLSLPFDQNAFKFKFLGLLVCRPVHMTLKISIQRGSGPRCNGFLETNASETDHYTLGDVTIGHMVNTW